MPRIRDPFAVPAGLVLGRELSESVAHAEQVRQRYEVEQVLARLRTQPGIVVADEVGMGKTFVALAVAHAVSSSNPTGPVVVMVPPALITKWAHDLKTFARHYVRNSEVIERFKPVRSKDRSTCVIRYGEARNSVELLKLFDDPAAERCRIVFLAQTAMNRKQTDKWVRLSLIAEALRRHGRRAKLAKVKKQIHRFLAQLIEARGEERSSDLGEELWEKLLANSPEVWRKIYNGATRDETRQWRDDPVPKQIVRALGKDSVNLEALADALEEMPVRAKGGDARVAERIAPVLGALRELEGDIWKEVLRTVRWRSPLLVLDEAHHLKNTDSGLARQLQARGEGEAERMGDAAMAGAFDRMLFLTATPFQLGHHELVRVLERFADVRKGQDELPPAEDLKAGLARIAAALDRSQRAALAFHRCWSKLEPPAGADVADWWQRLVSGEIAPVLHERAALDAYAAAESAKGEAEALLRPWIVRHNKGHLWAGSSVVRRQRFDGASVLDQGQRGGVAVPPVQMLPFFLAARSAARPSQDLLGEALCSSYEAFRETRSSRKIERDTEDDAEHLAADLSHSDWYLKEFDRALAHTSGANHPKIMATVRRVADLWEQGEKVVVFAFYRHTCRALLRHISAEIERRVRVSAQSRVGRELSLAEYDRLIERIQDRYFDKEASPGRKVLEQELGTIVDAVGASSRLEPASPEEREALVDIMRRFMRAGSTIARSFPLDSAGGRGYEDVVRRALDHADESNVSWRHKFAEFVAFLLKSEERGAVLEEIARVRVREQWVEADATETDGQAILPNVQSATGETDRGIRERRMRLFNTPFFPEIFVCSQVMGEGVDLQRYCRHVVHHDLDWNPSTIEQRTGRIDRLACKAEGKHSIVAYLPYLAGTADERQYHVMSDRERWFRVVMGQKNVERLIQADTERQVPLPDTVAQRLSFSLGLAPAT